MTATPVATVEPATTGRVWTWPVDPASYDRRAALTDRERQALEQLGEGLWHPLPQRRTGPDWQAIDRLVRPLDVAAGAAWRPDSPHHRHAITDAVGLVLLRCRREGTAFWGWSAETWVDLIGTTVAQFRSTRPGRRIDGTIRPYVLALAYLLCGFTAFSALGRFNRVAFSHRVFGRAVVEAEIQRLGDILGGWGYRFVGDSDGNGARLPTMLAHVLLVNRSPLLADLTTEAFARLRDDPEMQGWQANSLHAIQRAVASLGHCNPPPTPGPSRMPNLEGVPATWVDWITRWYETSTLTVRSRLGVRNSMARAGRWLVAEQPGMTEPGQWSRTTCAAWVAAIDRMRTGDHVQRHIHIESQVGKPLSAASKNNLLNHSRAFFRDLQEWEWIPRRFDPARAFATPPSIRALLGPAPRVIADDVWAKLLWAGLNLQADDLPVGKAGQWYPLNTPAALGVLDLRVMAVPTGGGRPRRCGPGRTAEGSLHATPSDRRCRTSGGSHRRAALGARHGWWRAAARSKHAGRHQQTATDGGPGAGRGWRVGASGAAAGVDRGSQRAVAPVRQRSGGVVRRRVVVHAGCPGPGGQWRPAVGGGSTSPILRASLAAVAACTADDGLRSRCVAAVGSCRRPGMGW